MFIIILCLNIILLIIKLVLLNTIKNIKVWEKHETVLDPEKHTHISWCDHRVGFLDIRLFNEVYNILNSDIGIMKKEEEKEEKEEKLKYSDL